MAMIRRDASVGAHRIYAFVAAVAAALSCAPIARAGNYSVSACRFGWSPDVHLSTGDTGIPVLDYCDRPEHALYAILSSSNGEVPAGDSLGWRFDAPADTAIVGFTVHWVGRVRPPTQDSAGVEALLETSSGTPGSFYVDAFDAIDSMTLADASWVRLSLLCERSPTSTPCAVIPTTPPYMYSQFVVKSSTFTLVDRGAPTVQSVGGAALTDTTWTGQEPISFSASDRGGGVYRVLVDVDGAIVESMPAVSDERCADATGERNFAYPVPCPTQAAGAVSIDASRLPGGRHTVAVYLEDVGGNRTTLLAPGPRFIVNDRRAVGYYANGLFLNPRFATPRLLNGDGATSNARLTAAFVRQVGQGRERHRVERAAREVRYSQRPTVRGTLRTPSGTPIARATVFVGQRPEGQQWRLDGGVVTDAKGRFEYRPLARQPNRRLRAVYFPFSDSHENATSQVLKLSVRAGMTLRVNRHRLRNGDRLVFTGRVLGPVPAAGVAVTLQAKVGKHYRSFRQLRATSRTGGRVRTVYRFERTTRPARYRFRLKVVRQAGLPFQSGVSPVVAASVRP
jgi:hypothetical protein